MRAVVLGQEGVEFEPAHADAQPAAGEVRVRVLRAGICETDLQLMRGYMGFRGVLGHEFVGIAEEGELQGERVVAEINCSCRKCGYCRSGQSNHCPHRSVLGILNHDGVFADSVTVPECNLHRVPDEIPTDVAVFTEPLAAAFQILEQIRVTERDRVVVLGDGRLGNLCAQVLALTGCHLAVVGKHENKLGLLESAGIETRLLDQAAPERRADVVVDCTGSESGLPTALEFVRPRGTVVLKTTVAGAHTAALAPVVIDELTVMGSRCGPFDKALRALQEGRIHVTPIVSATFSLPDAVEALRRAESADTLKVLLDVENR